MAKREELTVNKLVTPEGKAISTSGAGNISWGSAAPTTGSSLQGDIVYDSTPSAGSFIGWVCTTSGVNGSTSVWKTFGAITA